MLAYEIDVYVAQAEEILGKEVAHKKFNELKTRKWTKLDVSEGPGLPKKEHYVWCNADRVPVGNINDWWGRCTRANLQNYDPEYHAYVDLLPLWHVELRFRSSWPKSGVQLPSPDDFLWMVLALLSIDDPYTVPGVKEARCISIFHPKAFTQTPGG